MAETRYYKIMKKRVKNRFPKLKMPNCCCDMLKKMMNSLNRGLVFIFRLLKKVKPENDKNVIRAFRSLKMVKTAKTRKNTKTTKKHEKHTFLHNLHILHKFDIGKS
jgi:hypothetical protein